MWGSWGTKTYQHFPSLFHTNPFLVSDRNHPRALIASQTLWEGQTNSSALANMRLGANVRRVSLSLPVLLWRYQHNKTSFRLSVFVFNPAAYGILSTRPLDFFFKLVIVCSQLLDCGLASSCNSSWMPIYWIGFFLRGMLKDCSLQVILGGCRFISVCWNTGSS